MHPGQFVALIQINAEITAVSRIGRDNISTDIIRTAFWFYLAEKAVSSCTGVLMMSIQLLPQGSEVIKRISLLNHLRQADGAHKAYVDRLLKK